MKYFLICILSVGFLFLQSCSKEALEKDRITEDIELREGNLKDKNECFELVYPIGVVMPNGNVISVETEDELYRKMKVWYEANPDYKERPGLNYPVQVTFRGNKSKIIDSEDQMMRLKKYCGDEIHKERKFCFKLIYPITYTMPDGTTVSGETEVDIDKQLGEWYKLNPDAEQKPTLSYPIDIQTKDGNIVIVQSEEEMIAIKKRCNEQFDKDCFNLKFPVSFTMPDGSTVTVESKEDMNISFRNWYVAHPDEREKPNLNYPVDVIFDDDKVFTVNTEEDMVKLKRRCKEGK